MSSRILTTIGVLFAVITAVLTWLSFFSWFIPSAYILTAYMLLMATGMVGCLLIEKRFSVKTTKPALVALMVSSLTILSLLLLKDTFAQIAERSGDALVGKIERYKVEKGKYPESLQDEYFKENSKVTALGTSFNYHLINGSFELKYLAFGGYWRKYNSQLGSWIYHE